MFKRKAEELRAKHKKDHPQYKYQPRRKKSKVLAAVASSTSTVAEKSVRSSASKKAAAVAAAAAAAAKLKDYSRLSDSSASPTNSTNELYIDESVSPISDQGNRSAPHNCFHAMIFDVALNFFENICSRSVASLQANFSYPLQDGAPFDYPCNMYGNNNSTNHNHNTGNTSIHVNSSIAAGLGKRSLFARL